MNLAESITAAATKDVLIEGIWWRLRRPTGAAMLRAGAAMLPLVAPAREAIDKLPPEQQAAAAKAAVTEALLAHPLEVEELLKVQDLWVCACVTAATLMGPDGRPGEYESVVVVLDEHGSDPTASRLYVGDLPLPVRQALYTEAQSLAGSGGFAEAIARFRGGPNGGGADRRPGEEVRTDAP